MLKDGWVQRMRLRSTRWDKGAVRNHCQIDSRQRRDGLAAAIASERLPDDEIGGFIEEPDRSVRHANIGSARMVAGSGNVAGAKTGVSTAVFLARLLET